MSRGEKWRQREKVKKARKRTEREGEKGDDQERETEQESANEAIRYPQGLLEGTKWEIEVGGEKRVVVTEDALIAAGALIQHVWNPERFAKCTCSQTCRISPSTSHYRRA